MIWIDSQGHIIKDMAGLAYQDVAGLPTKQGLADSDLLLICSQSLSWHAKLLLVNILSNLDVVKCLEP